MDRFMPLLSEADIELADLPHEVALNGLLVYVGEFPKGGGRLFLHPSLGAYDSPQAVAVVAHELSHMLLSLFTDHPTCCTDLFLDPAKRALYLRYEAEADRLAAHLLVPPSVRAALPSARYPTRDHLARDLGVPTAVVARALFHTRYRPREIDDYLLRLTGQPHFLPPAIAIAA